MELELNSTNSMGHATQVCRIDLSLFALFCYLYFHVLFVDTFV